MPRAHAHGRAARAATSSARAACGAPSCHGRPAVRPAAGHEVNHPALPAGIRDRRDYRPAGPGPQIPRAGGGDGGESATAATAPAQAVRPGSRPARPGPALLPESLELLGARGGGRRRGGGAGGEGGEGGEAEGGGGGEGGGGAEAVDGEAWREGWREEKERARAEGGGRGGGATAEACRVNGPAGAQAALSGSACVWVGGSVRARIRARTAGRANGGR
jgi:hypothetical protein